MNRATLHHKNNVNKWYASRPHAFRMQDAHSTRMIQSFVMSVFVLFVFLSLSTAEWMMTETSEITRLPIEDNSGPCAEVILLNDLPEELNCATVQTPASGLGSSQSSEQKHGDRPFSRNDAAVLLASIHSAVQHEISTVIAELFGGLPTPSTTGIKEASLLSGHGQHSLRVASDGIRMSSSLGGGQIGFKMTADAIATPGRDKRVFVSALGGIGIVSEQRKPLQIVCSMTAMTVSNHGRSASEIEAAVRTASVALMSLYRTVTASDPSLRGKLVAEVFIQPDGTVTAARIIQKGIHHPVLENGMTNILRRTRFSAIKSTTVQRVEIPYVFSTGE